MGSPRGCGGFVPGNISGLRAAASGGWPPKRLAAARCAVASPSRAALLPAGYTSQKRAPCTSSGQSPLHSGRPCVHPSLRSLAPPLPTATASLGCGGGGKGYSCTSRAVNRERKNFVFYNYNEFHLPIVKPLSNDDRGFSTKISDIRNKRPLPWPTSERYKCQGRAPRPLRL